MVWWNVVQSLVENVSNICALHRIVCIRASVFLVHFNSILINIIRVDTFESGGFETNAEAANAAEQVDKCWCHDLFCLDRQMSEGQCWW